MRKLSPRTKKILLALFFVLLLILVIYLYTYYFAKDSKKVIFQDSNRRIYLIKKTIYSQKGSGAKREMWRMVYEDRTTGNRFFVFGNTPKGYKESKMSKIVLNTIDQGKTKSFDQVDTVGINIKKASTDIHSNLIDKKDPSDVFSFDGVEEPSFV